MQNISIDKQMDTLMNFTHISYSEKIQRAKDELLATDPNTVIKRWREERDKTFGGIYWGKIYLVGAKTWVGKSTFVNQICKNISDQGVKVVKYSLEDRMEDIGKEELFFEVNRMRYKDRKEKYERCDFVNNDIQTDEFYHYLWLACEELWKSDITEIDKERQMTIDDLCILMDQECDNWARVFAIDHLHYFEFSNTWERLDIQIQNVMHKINEMARKRNVAVFLVAHYKNTVWSWEPEPEWFKDAAAIKQVANAVIQIEREKSDPSKSRFYITKLRWPIKAPEFETWFDIWKFEYSFKKSSPRNKSIWIL